MGIDASGRDVLIEEYQVYTSNNKQRWQLDDHPMGSRTYKTNKYGNEMEGLFNYFVKK